MRGIQGNDKIKQTYIKYFLQASAMTASCDQLKCWTQTILVQTMLFSLSSLSQNDQQQNSLSCRTIALLSENATSFLCVCKEEE